MKKLIAVVLFLFSLCVGSANAQTRYLIGAAGADDLDNTSAGVIGSMETPFLKHYEIDLSDTASPYEHHVSLGSGQSNLASVRTMVWLTQHWGINGQGEYSSYNVTLAAKAADYAFGGLNYRAVIGGNPARFFLDYVQQFHNGVSPSGIETSHAVGGNLGFTVRAGCTGPMCVRLTSDYNFAQVWEQGNPACDGSIGPQTCGPRKKAIGGGFVLSVALEFPRHRGHEYDLF